MPKKTNVSFRSCRDSQSTIYFSITAYTSSRQVGQRKKDRWTGLYLLSNRFDCVSPRLSKSPLLLADSAHLLEAI